jgi:hypothetical protein
MAGRHTLTRLNSRTVSAPCRPVAAQRQGAPEWPRGVECRMFSPPQRPTLAKKQLLLRAAALSATAPPGHVRLSVRGCQVIMQTGSYERLIITHSQRTLVPMSRCRLCKAQFRVTHQEHRSLQSTRRCRHAWPARGTVASKSHTSSKVGRRQEGNDPMLVPGLVLHEGGQHKEVCILQVIFHSYLLRLCSMISRASPG